MPLTPKQNKIINRILKELQVYFPKLDKKILTDTYKSKTFEEFLENTKDYTTGNIFVTDGIADSVSNAVIEANNFQMLKQRTLVQETIQNKCYDLIKTAGDDLKSELREMAKKGYDLGLGSRELGRALVERDLEALYIVRGENTFTESEWQALSESERTKYTFNSKIKVISPQTRAKAIARTETKRAETIVNYIRAQERGKTKFRVVCRSDCCPLCAEIYQDLQDYTPTETKEAPLIDGVEYDMETDIDKLPPFHPNSYHKDTLVFTDKGWKLIKDINPDTDKVLSLKPDGTVLEFLRPNCIIKHYENKIINMNNKWFDIAVTTDHDCFIHQRRDGGKKGRYFEPQFRKPDELNTESRFLRCVDVDREQPAIIDVNGLKFKPDDFAFFMAWYISEGSVLHNPETVKKKGYPVKISQSIKENRIVLEKELKRICNYLGLKLRIGKEYFEIPSKALYDYLLPLGYSNTKYIPSEVFKLNKKSLNIFLDNYVRGDGHERIQSNDLVQNSKERVLFTSSTKLRDDLCYLILLCGYYPSIYLNSKKERVTKHKNGTYVQNYDVWTISINKSKYTNYSSLNVQIDENYNDYTYCVVLPKYHTLWVMRNGKTSFSGNCRCSAEFY